METRIHQLVARDPFGWGFDDASQQAFAESESAFAPARGTAHHVCTKSARHAFYSACPLRIEACAKGFFG